MSRLSTNAMTTDRLARARRTYADVTLAARARYTKAAAEADLQLAPAEAEARLTPKGRIDSKALAARSATLLAAQAQMEAEIGPARDEVDAAITAARRAGTYHNDTAPPAYARQEAA